MLVHLVIKAWCFGVATGLVPPVTSGEVRLLTLKPVRHTEGPLPVLLHGPSPWRVANALCLLPVPPKVSVSRRDAPDSSITLSCHASGSSPHPILISGMRDGKDILAEKESSAILPNGDGTYYAQSSLEISLHAEDRHCYACRVEHSSLPEPALIWDKAPGKKGPRPLWALASIVLAVLVLVGAVGASVTLWRRKSAGPWKPSYALAATKNGEDSASSSSSGTDTQSMGARS
ncbi:H-2 class I histocompatibility antigen, alpha chain-like [Macrochelys suwanniensis]